MGLLYACNQVARFKIDSIPRNKTLFDIFVEKQIVAIGVYCLMPNHFHILCTEIVEGGISKFMQKVLTGYTVFFNRKHDREGALFSSRYKTKHVDTDSYAEYIKKYIYFNPLKIIKPDYNSKDFLLYEKKFLTPEEKIFLDEYPYKI